MSDSAIRLKWSVRLWILPGHLGTAGDFAMALRLTTSGKSTIVFRWPQHCISALKIKWGIQEPQT